MKYTSILFLNILFGLEMTKKNINISLNSQQTNLWRYLLRVFQQKSEFCKKLVLDWWLYTYRGNLVSIFLRKNSLQVYK